jgi:Fe-S-cluster containining protein
MKIIPILSALEKSTPRICPFLDKDELCSIYETRPSCCRSYPGKGRKYPFTAKIIHSCDSNCSACINKCCKNVQIATNATPTPADFLEGLNVSCSECPKTFC